MAKVGSKTTISLESLDKILQEYLVTKAPALPANWKQTLVKFIPWITLVFFVLTLPVVLAFFGVSAFVLPFTIIGGGSGLNYAIGVIFLAGSMVFEAMAIPGLFKQTKKSWQYLYYSVLLSGLYYLITLNLGSLIFGTLLSLYILYQIKNSYK